MDQELIFMTIIGMALVTYIPRVIPLLALSGKNLPKLVIAWLRFVPAAVLAAMLTPAILLENGQFAFGTENLFLWAALPTLIAAVLTKSLFLPVVVGMLVVIIGRMLIG